MRWTARKTHDEIVRRKTEWHTTFAWWPRRTKEGFRVWLEHVWTRLESHVGMFSSYRRVYAILPDQSELEKRSYPDKKLCIICNEESRILVCESCSAAVKSFKVILMEERRLED